MPDDPLFSPDAAVGPANSLQAAAIRQILRAGAVAAAVGAGGRAVSGLGDFLGRNLATPAAPFRSSTIEIPAMPAAAPPAHRRPKVAAGPPAEPDFLGRTSQLLAKATGLARAPGQEPNPVAKAVGGWGASSMQDMPWAIPAGVAAVGGGLYGGYKLTDWLLDKTRKNEIDGELEEAKQHYHDAMLGQYGKAAAAGGDPIDALYEKRAGLLAPAAGLALTGMGGLGLLSGMAAYRYGREHSPTRALQEAIRRRQEALSAAAPRPVLAIAAPPEEDDEARPKLGSAAGAAATALQHLREGREQAARRWQFLLNGPEKPDRAAAKPAPPAAPQLPTLAGLGARQSVAS